MSQETKMLKMLRQAGKTGIPNRRFSSNGILSYTKRISNLRKDGYNIITERLVLPNGRSTGIFYYILIEDRKPSLWDRIKGNV